jgi:CheY-like chemotaxis protein
MPTESEFKTLVAQAYERLYDLVYLRCHPLADLLIGETALERKERAWKLHHLLLQALDDLDPGPGAPATSVEVRRHQLMVLRYADGLDPQTTADRLAISRRHFYREHEAALDAVAQVLWQRYLDAAPRPLPAETAHPPADRAQLLRQEAERLAQTDRFAYLHEVLPGVLSLLGGRLCQRNLTLEILVSPTTPPVGLDRNLLRQLLLAALSFLAERCTDASLTLAAEADATHIDVRLTVAAMPMPTGAELHPELVEGHVEGHVEAPPAAAPLDKLRERDTGAELVEAPPAAAPFDKLRARLATQNTGAEPVEAPSAAAPFDKLRARNTADDAAPSSWEAALAPVQELASLGQAAVRLLGEAGALAGLALRLPRVPQRTVLVVDDNRDALEFFHRVLPYHGYRVVSAATGREALQQARTLLPHAIVLDVMMPEQDGWDVLQVLRNQPETQEIPVVICSVLRAAELALSMGASAFLAKPLTEDALLTVLRGLMT